MTRAFGAIAVAILACLALSAGLRPIESSAASTLPARLSDQEFWNLVNEYLESGGYFPSDNFVSNETEFQTVIPSLSARLPPGTVYLGVGPDQNFTYVVALKPQLAFIIDIRRQNLLEHLMYKVLIESSSDRADFLSRLFSRKRPDGLSAKSTALQLLEGSFNALPDKALYQANSAAIFAALRKHGFALTPDDEQSLSYVYSTFVDAGPSITYSSGQSGYTMRPGGRGFGGRGFRGMPNYAELMLAHDRDGVDRSYLSTEERFSALRAMERDNRIVPVVGDFAGSKAIRAVGRYVRQHGSVVSAFYLSNVEQYLFQSPTNWRQFYANVATLPLADASAFIRSCFQGCAGVQTPQTAVARGAMRSAQLTESIPALLGGVKSGKIASYADVLAHSK